MDQKNDQKNGQKWLKILSKKMIKNDQKNVPKMTQKNEQKWGPKIDFFGDLSRILKKWYQIDSFPRVSLWPAGRPVDLHSGPHYFLQTHASRAKTTRIRVQLCKNWSEDPKLTPK